MQSLFKRYHYTNLTSGQIVYSYLPMDVYYKEYRPTISILEWELIKTDFIHIDNIDYGTLFQIEREYDKFKEVFKVDLDEVMEYCI